MSRTYLCIDLKSFYASVECVERQLNPLTANLVVADPARTEKTICLAVSPSLKAWGIPGRPRLFQVVRQVKELNAVRKKQLGGGSFSGSSIDADQLKADRTLALDYVTAPPRMALYLQYSTRIYQIYLKYIAPEDIHVYSIDEVFMDISDYLLAYAMTPRELAMTMIRDVLRETGITATAGIGTNLYLGKIAMDIVAKHMPPDADGVRIAELDEMSYRRRLWGHRPLTDFWRVGRGYAKKLEANGLYTMGDIARCSLGTADQYHNEELLYRLFGVNAELLIDHAWGWESCTMADIKAYRPERKSMGSGQVLPCPYAWEKGRLVVQEMTDQLALDLVEHGLVTDQAVLYIGYDRAEPPAVSSAAELSAPRAAAVGAVSAGKRRSGAPGHAHGTARLQHRTSSSRELTEAVLGLYDRIVDPRRLIRRVCLTAGHVLDEAEAGGKADYEQLDLFTDYEQKRREREAEDRARDREHRLQLASLEIRRKFGKNAILKGMNLEEGATAIQRNEQIGGHKA